MTADTIVRLKITLDNVKPTVLRRVEVPFNIRLDRLHLTVQAAMGWTNSHLYPRLIEVGGRCPPEDCGSPWGYAELLDAVKDPKHERHAELMEWIGDDFDPDADQAEWLTAEVAALAKTWSRRSATKRTRRN